MLSGFGHIRAGEALLDYAKENFKDIKIKHVDVCNIDPFFKKYARIYKVFTKKFPFLWGMVYKHLPTALAKKIVFWGNITSNKIKEYVKQEKPDIIIFTNITIVPIFMADLKKILPNTKIAVIVTDYHAHPYYVFKEVDYYFVGHYKIKDSLMKIGIDKRKIIVSGIPINPKFYIKQNIKDLKKKYNIENSSPVVLFIASFRLQDKELLFILRQLLEFKPKVNLILITNGNKSLYDLANDNFPKNDKLLIINWTNMMEEYIKISDVVISKAGGLTVTECLAIKKPMIIVRPIPGQEEHNATFVQENHFGQKVDNIKDITNVLNKFILQKNNKVTEILPNGNPSKNIFEILLK